MNVVFETEPLPGVKYRHLYYHEHKEATVENLVEMIRELSKRLDEYTAGDHVRHSLKIELQKQFETNELLAVLSYRVSKLL